jgi:hypothetical protein
VSQVLLAKELDLAACTVSKHLTFKERLPYRLIDDTLHVCKCYSPDKHAVPDYHQFHRLMFRLEEQMKKSVRVRQSVHDEPGTINMQEITAIVKPFYERL